MAYNKARAEKEWLKWKNEEEAKLRELGVDEVYIDHVSGTLNPGGLTTRTQAAVILQCFIETVAK